MVSIKKKLIADVIADKKFNCDDFYSALYEGKLSRTAEVSIYYDWLIKQYINKEEYHQLMASMPTFDLSVQTGQIQNIYKVVQPLFSLKWNMSLATAKLQGKESFNFYFGVIEIDEQYLPYRELVLAIFLNEMGKLVNFEYEEITAESKSVTIKLL